MALQVRRGTQADLIASNLLLGEPAYAIDTKRFLIGSGDSNPLLVVTQDSGSWTPHLYLGEDPLVPISEMGLWTKTGNVVTVYIDIICGDLPVGNLRIYNMPPEIRPSSARYISGMVAVDAGSPNKMLIGGSFGTAGIMFLQKNGGGYLKGEDIVSGDRIILNGSYILLGG